MCVWVQQEEALVEEKKNLFKQNFLLDKCENITQKQEKIQENV